MFKIENKSIDLIFENEGKIVKKITLKNRLVDNYLNFILFYMLPRDIGNALFPEFAGETSFDDDYKIFQSVYENLMNLLLHRKCVSPRITIFIGDPPFLK